MSTPLESTHPATSQPLSAVKHLLRNRPRLYSLSRRLAFALDPVRLARLTASMPARWRHRKTSVVLAGPGDLGFRGGLYNPGAVASPEGPILLAKGQHAHWWDAVGANVDAYFQGDPVLFQLDRRLATRACRMLRLEGFPESGTVGYEDFRLFRCRDEIWANHGMITIRRRHACAATWSGATPCLSRVDVEAGTLSFAGFPTLDFPLQHAEKNWLFFEQDQVLYLLYSLAPYRLLRLADRERLRFETVITEDFGPQLGDIGGYGSLVSFSTNPIDYDDAHLLLLAHQTERLGVDRIYRHWGVLLDRESLLPTRVTRAPLWEGMGARGRRPGILYVSSVVRQGDELVFFIGEGDAFVTYGMRHRKDIDALLRPLRPRQSGRR